MSKVAIIGGGASGMVAAIMSARNKNEVTIFERNNQCGKKILITGNGKCNYWNEDQDLNHYHSCNEEIIKQIMEEKYIKKIPTFFEELGILPKIKNNYYYPYSSLAASIQMALIEEMNYLNIVVIEEKVDNINKENNQFIINNKKFDKVVLSTGGKATPKTGSDGTGYLLAQSFNHSIIKPNPALVSLISNQNLKEWQGIRCDSIVSLYINDKFIKSEIGEIQLTDYGVSGICIFNLSYLVSQNKNQNITIEINFLPWLNKTKKELIEFIENRNQIMKNRTILELLEGILNYKLVSFLLKKIKINKDSYLDDLSKKELELLVEQLLQFKLTIVDTNSFDKAQVCSGGVPLIEINPITMESLKEKNLYIIGELLDVNGDCGGYNLSFAWVTGYKAGSSMKGELHD